jgi:hypothetical protein
MVRSVLSGSRIPVKRTLIALSIVFVLTCPLQAGVLKRTRSELTCADGIKNRQHAGNGIIPARLEPLERLPGALHDHGTGGPAPPRPELTGAGGSARWRALSPEFEAIRPAPQFASSNTVSLRPVPHAAPGCVTVLPVLPERHWISNV